MHNTKFKIYDRILRECDAAISLCTDDKTKNDIWDKTMETMNDISQICFFAIQRELEDEFTF